MGLMTRKAGMDARGLAVCWAVAGKGKGSEQSRQRAGVPEDLYTDMLVSMLCDKPCANAAGCGMDGSVVSITHLKILWSFLSAG